MTVVFLGGTAFKQSEKKFLCKHSYKESYNHDVWKTKISSLILITDAGLFSLRKIIIKFGLVFLHYKYILIKPRLLNYSRRNIYQYIDDDIRFQFLIFTKLSNSKH